MSWIVSPEVVKAAYRSVAKNLLDGESELRGQAKTNGTDMVMFSWALLARRKGKKSLVMYSGFTGNSKPYNVAYNEVLAEAKQRGFRVTNSMKRATINPSLLPDSRRDKVTSWLKAKKIAQSGLTHVQSDAFAAKIQRKPAALESKVKKSKRKKDTNEGWPEVRLTGK